MKPRMFLLGASLLVSVSSAFAFRIEWGRSVTISAPVFEDVYVAGGNIVINAPIHGDLIIAGGTIHINDTVMNDILLAGGNVTFNGFVGDDIRCAGGNLYILKDVAGDIVITGGTISIAKGATIGGLIAGGGEVTLEGTAGDAKVSAGTFILEGTVMKDLDCRSGNIRINGIINGKSILSSSRRILIGDNADFRGEVRYWSRHDVDWKQSVKSGKAEFDSSLKMKYGRWYYLGFNAFWGLLWYLGTAFTMILIIQYLFSATMRRAGDTFYNSTLRSLAYGFLFCIAVPVIAFVCLILVVGVPAGLILLFNYVILLLLSTVITSVVSANWLNNLGNKRFGYWKLCFSALALFVLFKILTFTPFFGWFIMALFVFIAFGAILQNIRWRREKPGPMTA